MRVFLIRKSVYRTVEHCSRMFVCWNMMHDAKIIIFEPLIKNLIKKIEYCLNTIERI